MSCIPDIIRERRSIRKYAPRPVPTETLREVLEAAGWAPSAHNAQPWRFIVLIDKPSKKELSEAMANAGIKDMINYEDKSQQKSERDLAVQSLGAAVQNMLLAAHSKNLGACWFCAPVFCKEAVRQVLKIPEDVEPQALITLGYPAEKPSAPCRTTLANYAFSGFWGKKLRED